MKPTIFCVCVSMFVPGTLFAEEGALGPVKSDLEKSTARAVDFLKTTQSEDGSWTDSNAVGISALVTYGLLLADVPADDPAVAKALKYLVSYCQDDGRICAPKSRTSGYETCVALMTLKEANASGAYTAAIRKAEKFVRTLQVGVQGDADASNISYGGAGYSPGGGRADLSNTAFLVEALHAAGAKPDDPALQRALLFVSKCQNLESEFNTSPAAARINDGGFYYTVAAEGESAAGTTNEGGLRSYGSMTYAGLKSMLFAGVTPNDPRVKAANDWIRKNYTVADNPGMGNNGLFYYYQLFAKALDAAGLERIEDAQGRQHDWRKELAEHLFSLQQTNGSWVNTSKRWYEGDPHLVTAYTLIALSYCEPRQ